jgi:hypothetical protein
MPYPRTPSPKESVQLMRYERLRAGEALGGQEAYWTEERLQSWWLHL